MSSLPVSPNGYPPPFATLSNLETPTWPTQNDGPVVSAPPLTAALWNTTYLNHTIYNIASVYRYSSGIDVLPIAGPVGTNNRGVQFQAPQMLRFVFWHLLSEDSTLPTLPNPEPSGYEILVTSEFSFLSPDLDAGGAIRGWEAKGWYLYKEIVPRTLSYDGLFAGAPATDQISYGQTVYTTANFVSSLLGPTPPPAAGVTPFPLTGAEGLGL
jgi:hypothetical protein